MLIPASIVGLFCFIYGWATLGSDKPSNKVCDKSLDVILLCPACSIDCDFTVVYDSCIYSRFAYLFDNPATVFFAVFMSLWATVYLEMWKRYSARITHKWDLSNFDAFEEYPRPEYLARLSNAEKKKLNVITRMYEPYVPYWQKQLPYTILSVSIVCLLIIVALASVVGVIVYRVTVRAALATLDDEESGVNSQDKSTLRTFTPVITATTAAVLNLMCILAFNWVYSRMAIHLTELEMPRTQTEFDNSLTLKMFLLQFVNYYSSIFYIAFFKGRFVGHPGDMTMDRKALIGKTQEECPTGGCLLELAIQLAFIMIGKQALGAVWETSQPWLEFLWNKWKLQRIKKRRLSTMSAGEEEEEVEHPSSSQWEDDYALASWGPQSLFYEYLEMVLQFGFVTIFVAAFPLAPLFALLNNIFEIRLDAKKMITAFRRPVAQRVKNIGIWYKILDTIGKMSVITNAIIIAFTSDFIPRLYYYYENGSLEGYFESTLSLFEIGDLKRQDLFKEIEEYKRRGHNDTYC